MYTPPSFGEARPEVLRDLMRRYPFGTLVSTSTTGPQVTHLPFLIDEQCTRLRGHMARANAHWQTLNDGSVLAIFQGPHAYISPTYYAAEFAVPTWNYVAIHATGTARIIEDPTAVQQLLDDLIAASDTHGWRMPWQHENSAGMLAAIVAFEIDIERLEGKAKLGQNRSAEDQDRTARALATSARPGDRELADFMAEYLPRKETE
jgi:transcriptional regulator